MSLAPLLLWIQHSSWAVLQRNWRTKREKWLSSRGTWKAWRRRAKQSKRRQQDWYTLSLSCCIGHQYSSSTYVHSGRESEGLSRETDEREGWESPKRRKTNSNISAHLYTVYYTLQYCVYISLHLSSTKEILHHGMAYGSGLYNFTPVTSWH